MTVKEFITQLVQCHHDDKTIIDFGACDSNGEWYPFNLKMVEENIDKEYEENSVDVILELSKEHRQQIQTEENEELEDDLKDMIQKYCF